MYSSSSEPQSKTSYGGSFSSSGPERYSTSGVAARDPAGEIRVPNSLCYDPDTPHFHFSHMTHYLTRAGTPMTHSDSRRVTHHLRIVPYDIITDVTMTHADSCLLTYLHHHDSY